MKWITREHPKIDRLACPWLIKRFIDREAKFLYVPFEAVQSEAERLNAIPYDIPVWNIPTTKTNVPLTIL